MLVRSYFFLLFGMFFIILHCKNQLLDDEIQPTPVQWIPTVDDTCRIERGIDAVPEGTAIYLEWLPSDEDIVRGYEIYRSASRKGGYQIVADQTILTQFDSLYIDYGVTNNNRYYYFIKAVSDAGITSNPSDTVDYKLIEKAVFLSIQQGVSPSKPLFQWKDPTNWQASPYYVIRLISAISGDYIWISQVNPQFGSEFQQIPYNEDGTAVMDSLTSGVDYNWRIDISGSENHCGSESQWIQFQLKR